MFVDIKTARGYGKLYQSVMRDPTLPLKAKAIYAYLATYVSNAEYAYPSREKILKDLRISKDTFTKYLRILKEKGYIRCEHIPKLNNRYYILEPAKDNYGIIPKVVMLDNRLNIQSKAVYAYFCSFTGSTDIAFPRLKTILRDLDITEAMTRLKPRPCSRTSSIASTRFTTPAGPSSERTRTTRLSHSSTG